MDIMCTSTWRTVVANLVVLAGPTTQRSLTNRPAVPDQTHQAAASTASANVNQPAYFLLDLTQYFKLT